MTSSSPLSSPSGLEALQELHSFQPTDTATALCESITKFGNEAGLSGSERMFSCRLCGKRMRKSNLRAHFTAVHQHQRPFQCPAPTCNFVFAKKQNMETHFATVHQNRKAFECTHCRKQFRRAAAARVHLREVVGIRYRCSAPDCNKDFKDKSNLLRHMKKVHKQLWVDFRLEAEGIVERSHQIFLNTASKRLQDYCILRTQGDKVIRLPLIPSNVRSHTANGSDNEHSSPIEINTLNAAIAAQSAVGHGGEATKVAPMLLPECWDFSLPFMNLPSGAVSMAFADSVSDEDASMSQLFQTCQDEILQNALAGLVPPLFPQNDLTHIMKMASCVAEETTAGLSVAQLEENQQRAILMALTQQNHKLRQAVAQAQAEHDNQQIQQASLLPVMPIDLFFQSSFAPLTNDVPVGSVTLSPLTLTMQPSPTEFSSCLFKSPLPSPPPVGIVAALRVPDASRPFQLPHTA